MAKKFHYSSIVRFSSLSSCCVTFPHATRFRLTRLIIQSLFCYYVSTRRLGLLGVNLCSTIITFQLTSNYCWCTLLALTSSKVPRRLYGWTSSWHYVTAFLVEWHFNTSLARCSLACLLAAAGLSGRFVRLRNHTGQKHQLPISLLHVTQFHGFPRPLSCFISPLVAWLTQPCALVVRQNTLLITQKMFFTQSHVV